MSGRTLKASAAPSVSEEQIERARVRKIVTIAEDGKLELKRRKKEYWALCCFHEEDTPSLSFNPEKNVFHCHGCGKGGGVIDFVMARDKLDFAAAVRMLAGENETVCTKSLPTDDKPLTAEQLCPAGYREVRAYAWPDEAGVTQYETVRYEHLTAKQKNKPGKPKKTFRARRPILGQPGLYIASRESVPPVVFRKDQLAARPSDDLHWAEGEEHALALEHLGLLATTTASGAQGVRAYSVEELRWAARGRNVFLHADYDAEGNGYAEFVAATVAPVAQSIRVVQHTEFGPGGDVLDRINAGATADVIRAIGRESPQWQPTGGDESSGSAGTKPNASRLVVRTMSGIEPKETDWLLHRWLARGKFHLFGGLAGDGKSTIAAAIAAIGSVGGTWPDGAPAPRFRTLFLLGEDALDDTLRPRLDVHGADVDQILAIETVLDDDGRVRFFNVEKHLPLLESAIEDHRVDLVVIDPLTTIMPGSDRNAEGDTRDALTPLVKLAERTNAAVLGIAHVGKGGAGQRTAAQRILGATAFVAIARIVWMTAPASDDQMVLGVVKSNLAMKPDSLLWSRDEDAAISWHGVSSHSVEDLLQGAVSKAPRADAEGFLRELLTAGSMASADVEQTAKTAGISWRTLRRAADDLGVEKWREGGADGHWRWRLPNGQPRYAEPAPRRTASNLSTFPGVDKSRDSNLATPIDTEVDKLDKLTTRHLSNGADSGQVHATTPISRNRAPNADSNVMEGGQVGHMQFSRGGQVNPLDRCVDVEPAVAETAANLATLTAEELAQLRAEVDAAALDDPYFRHDRAALAHFDAMHSVGASVAIATAKGLRQRVAGWPP